MDRKKIFEIFAGFLAVMLAFTILSRAVSGASMARVETVKISTGTIEHKVVGSGKVEAGKEIAVYTESGQRVKEIFVREGQTVQEGDLLFQVDLDELEEQIIMARQEIEKTKLQNQDAQSSRNLEQQNREIAQSRAAEDYNQAVTQGDADIAKAKAAWDAAEAALQEFLQNSSQANKGSEINISSNSNKIGNVPLKSQGREVKNYLKMKGIESGNAKGEDGNENHIESDREKENNNIENRTDINNNNDNNKENSTEDNNAKNHIEDNDVENHIEDNNAKNHIEDNDVENHMENNTQSNNDSENNEGNTGEMEGNAEWEEQKAALEHAIAEAKANYEAAVSSRTDNIRAAARALEDASRQPATDSTAKQNEITKQQQELTLNKLLALQQAEGKIISPVRGMVTQILITTGDFTSEGTAIRLADISQGTRLVASVDKSNEKYISKGSPVNITISGSKDKITNYTVSNIKENEEDKTLLDVTIDLPEGVLDSGISADIEILQKSKNYSTVLPVQAIHEEQNNYYVFILQEEKGVMGTELVVKRLNVEIQDKNNTDAALGDGILTGDQEVVSNSSRAISEGNRVRKKE